MEFTTCGRDRADEAAELFRAAFTASEGDREGALIGQLAKDLIETTPPAALFGFAAREAGALAGCILFSRLAYTRDARRVVLLGPVAVAPDWQGKGVGQALLRHGLSEIAARGVDVAITYGDPAFYARVGFCPITVEEAAPPLPLSRPEGWLGLSLTKAAFTPLTGPSRCVPALNDPDFW